MRVVAADNCLFMSAARGSGCVGAELVGRRRGGEPRNVGYLRAMHRIREAHAEDRGFVIEMARLACTLEDRPLPEPDDPQVLACLPLAKSAAVIATDPKEHSLGAAWWYLHERPLVVALNGSPLPELTIAVVDDARGHGVGTALIEALASNAAPKREGVGDESTSQRYAA